MSCTYLHIGRPAGHILAFRCVMNRVVTTVMTWLCVLFCAVASLLEYFLVCSCFAPVATIATSDEAL
jgi:hypothetical protein